MQIRMKRIFSSFGFFVVLLMFLASGCVSVYMPNVPNVPMLTSKGELSTGGHITLKGNVTFNNAYAVSDHFAVLLNGAMLNSQREKRDFRHNLLEAGGGYFTTFGPEQNRVLEVYSGIGRGSSDRIEKEESSAESGLSYTRREGSFNKYFLQVNYSSKRKKDLLLLGRNFPLNYGTALRVSYLNMTEYQLNGIAQPNEDNIFLEPIFFTRLTLNPAVQLQYTSGSNFGLKNRKTMTAAYSVFSVGFVINVGGMNLNKR